MSSFLNNKVPPKLRTSLTLSLSILVSLLLTPILLTFALIISSIRVILSLYFRLTTRHKVKLIQSMDSFQVYDKPNNLLETYTVLIFEGVGDLNKIRKVFDQKVIQNEEGLYNKLKSRVVKKFGFYCWELLEPTEFRVEDHIKVVESNVNLRISPGLNNNTMEIKETAFSEKQLLDKVGDFYKEPMSIDKPRWEVWVIPKFSYDCGYGQGMGQGQDEQLHQDKPHYAIILRVHHSIMDGISTYLLLTRVLSDPDLSPGSVSFSSSASMPIDPLKKPDNVTITSKVWTYLKLLLVWPILLHENVASPQESNCFHGVDALGEKKIVKWTNHFRIETLKKIRHTNGTNFSTNSVLNAAVGGAFYRLAQTKGFPIPDQVTAVTSIPMLPYPDLKPQNRFSGAFFPLLVGGGGGADRLDRLKVTHVTLRDIHASPLILLNSVLLRFIGILPAAWSQNMTDSRELTVLTSNIPGPRVAGYFFGGDKLLDVAGFLPIKNKTGFGFCFVSYCGNIRAAIVADETVASEQDVEILRDSFQEEIVQMELDAEFRNHKRNVEMDFDHTWVELGLEI